MLTAGISAITIQCAVSAAKDQMEKPDLVTRLRSYANQLRLTQPSPIVADDVDAAAELLSRLYVPCEDTPFGWIWRNPGARTAWWFREGADKPLPDGMHRNADVEVKPLYAAPQVPGAVKAGASGQNVEADRSCSNHGLCDERLAGGSNPAAAAPPSGISPELLTKEKP